LEFWFREQVRSTEGITIGRDITDGIKGVRGSMFTGIRAGRVFFTQEVIIGNIFCDGDTMRIMFTKIRASGHFVMWFFM
jgi:hypothetical protein